ncbi:IS3 family transposase [Streptomyces sp. YIM 121038]|uniref:IS3 family transposase n=1 Tax=Streptomyces sp. YIM 121038 TaxID=2136401 RepID=UPI0011105284|nr:IS3 family transposase [Streptomyces sp. YIM 121038]
MGEETQGTPGAGARRGTDAQRTSTPQRAGTPDPRSRDGKHLPEKSRSVLRGGSPAASTYEFIDETRLDTTEYAYSVGYRCKRLGVSKSGYYDWRGRPESATAERREELKLLITKAFEDSDSTYSHRRIHAQPHRRDVTAGLEPARRLTREPGLEPSQPKPKRFGLTQGTPGPAPDLAGRNFTADAPGQKPVGDITYVSTSERWLYLATAIDRRTKEIIGYAMDDHYHTPLTSRAIRNTARNRKLTDGTIFHSDRGSNYRPAEHGETLKHLGLPRSAGRTGTCFSNTMTESFFAALKNERVSRMTYLTREATRQDITRYIESWHKHKHLHSAVGNRPPCKVHTEYQTLHITA